MYVGLDIGTSGIKGLLLDEAMGFVATASAPLCVSRPHEGWSEQAPADWLAAIEDVMASLAASAPNALRAVQSIGLSGQMHGLVALDARGDILRPAILWNDVRNGEEASALDSATDDFRVIGGNAVMPGFTAPKVSWLAHHEPEMFAKMAHALLPKDYVRFVLSGERLSDMSDASGTLWLDVGKRDYSDQLLGHCGLTRAQMPQLVEGSQPAGRLKGDIAQRWGIKGRPIIAGAGDNAAAACGLGVVEAGDGFISLGTSGVVFVVTDDFAPAADSGAHAFCHALPDKWHQMGVILSATDSLNWLSEITNHSVSALAEAAASIDMTKARPYFHPYLSGERTPHNDANARGGFIGLSRSHSIAEMAFAVMEGVAFALADCVRVLQDAGSHPTRFIATGGGARNHQWLQMIADVTGCEIDLPIQGDYGAALGAARLGALATGQSQEAILTKPAIERVFKADSAYHDAYQARYQTWQRLYQAVKDI